MKMSFFTYIAEFLSVLALVVNSIQFLLFSLAGIEYYADSGNGLVAILNITCCLYTVAWVFVSEIQSKQCVHSVKWPYFFPLFIIFFFVIESVFFEEVKYESIAGRQLNFFVATSVPSIYLATYIYRHDRFDMITRNSDVIMLICTLALGLNIPNMLGGSGATIAGAGGHQEISYSAAFCFGINWVNIISGKFKHRFYFFQKQIWRYLFIGLLPLQAMICILGGGRGGGVLLVVCFFATIFIFARKNFGRTIIWSIIAVAIFAFIAVQSGQFAEGFGRTFNYLDGGKFSLENDMSDMERTALRVRSYKIIGESPVLGYGLWNGLVVAGYYMHNVFLDVLIAGGFTYLIIFLFLMKKIYVSAVHIIRFDSSKAILLPWILYPTTLLMFSGFYMTFSYFWFFSIYCWLNRKNLYS